jgi:hypothetical protein
MHRQTLDNEDKSVIPWVLVQIGKYKCRICNERTSRHSGKQGYRKIRMPCVSTKNCRYQSSRLIRSPTQVYYQPPNEITALPSRTIFKRTNAHKLSDCKCTLHSRSRQGSFSATWTEHGTTEKTGSLFYSTTVSPTQLSPPPSMVRQPLVGQGLLIVEDLRFHSDTSHSIGLLWMSDQPVAETSTWQHITLTRDTHPCPQRDSYPQSHQTQAFDHPATGIGPHK